LDYWTIGLGDARFPIKDIKGLRYIQRLLLHPNKEFHALDLLSTAGGGAPAPDTIVGAEEALPVGITVRRGLSGDSGEMLDEQAKREYGRRLNELNELLEDQRERGNHERADQIEREIEALSREIKRAVGLGGRDRRSGSNVERARLSVTRAIKTALEKILEYDRALGELLDDRVRTGVFCRYAADPEQPITWRFSIDETEKGLPLARPDPAYTQFAATDLLGAAGQRTAFVGRDGEREALRKVFEQVRTGSGRVVMITGAPGVGKSRIAAEFAREALLQGTQVLAGTCHERDDSIPFEPFVEILEGAFAQSPSPQVFRQLLGEEAPEIARLMPQLRRSFPDIPPASQPAPDQARRILFNALASFFARLAESGPVVVVLEDLHWADTGSLSLLTHLARCSSSIPLMTVGTYRDKDLDASGPLAKFIDEVIRLHIIEQMVLRGLPQPAVGEMIQALSGKVPPEALVFLIYSYTEGNPFFIEALFQHLMERGQLTDSSGELRRDYEQIDIDLPQSLRVVIGRWLARLSDAAQKALSLAAVIGRSFTFQLLEAAGHLDPDSLLDCIDEAERSGLISSTQQYPEAYFQFSHELIRHAVLAGLSVPRVQRFHRDVADAIERLYAGTMEDHAVDLAHHLWQAGSASDPGRAVRYLTLAGMRALDQSAYEAALVELRKALELIPKLPDSPERAQSELDLQLALGVAAQVIKGWYAEEVGEAYRRARELCGQLGEDVRFFWVLFGLWGYHLVRGEYRISRSLTAEMIELMSGLPDEISVAATWAAGPTQFLMGDFADAHASLERCTSLYDRQRHRTLAQRIGQDPCMSAMSYDAMTLWLLGYPDQAEVRAQESLAFARELRHPFTLAFCLTGFGFYHWLSGDYPAAEKTLEESLALCREHGFTWFERNSLRFWVVVMALQGKLETEASLQQITMAARRDADPLYLSRAFISAALKKSSGIANKSAVAQNFMMDTASGDDFSQTFVCSALAECFGRAGKFDVATSLLAEAEALAQRSEERYAESTIHRIRGEVSLMRINARSSTSSETHAGESAAEQSFLRAIEIATRQNARMPQLQAAMSLSHLYKHQGKRSDARKMLTQILEWFAAGSRTTELREARALLSQL
jgi:tetratricopeptide (TPR) repeat protein